MKKLNFKSLINELKLNYIFDKFEYKDINTNSIVTCTRHGDFLSSVKRLKKGQGCPHCYKENKIFSKLDFINRSNKIHEYKYDYSFSNYTNSTCKVKILCNKHGIFEQFASNHLKGWGCPSCKIEKQKMIFIENAKKIHANKFDYHKVNYKNNKTEIEILCNVHGSFYQRPDNHIQGNGCPKCSLSKGERIIENILRKYKIKFVTQKKFDQCEFKYKLRFDFFLPAYNMCIEYDGIQHFIPVKYFGDQLNLENNINKDSIKDNFCLNNNIKLLRINYLQEENIEDLILDFLKKIINSDVSTEQRPLC